MAHAKLNASTAKRWKNCPGSIALIDKLGVKSTSTFFAKQGTAAHGLLQVCLEKKLYEARAFLGRVIRLVGEDETASMLREGAEPKPGDFVVDEEMADAVQVHIDYVLERMQTLGAEAEYFSEKRVEVPEVGFGTSDTVISSWPELLEAVDYKHGAGVLVDVEGNEQLRYYLLGQAIEDGFTHKFYRSTVVQPRCDHADGPVRSEDISREELIQFYDDLKKAARETERANAPLQAGSWCKFCPAAGQCSALREQAEKAAGADFSEEPKDLTPPDEAHGLDAESMGRYMLWADKADAWVRAVRKRATQMLMHGAEVKGFKLVRGKDGNRKWSHNDQILVEQAEAEFLGELTLDDFAPREFKSPAQFEKLKVPKERKKALKDWVADRVTRPPGKIVVAEESDPRERITAGEAAASDFGDVEDEEEFR